MKADLTAERRIRRRRVHTSRIQSLTEMVKLLLLTVSPFAVVRYGEYPVPLKKELCAPDAVRKH